MAPRPPPRFVVHAHDIAGQRRRRLWLLLAWPASVVAAIALAVLALRHPLPAIGNHRQQAVALVTQRDQLKQQVADLQRSEQVGDIALRSLRSTLTEREEEISGLRADLGFYSRLVGGDDQREGLKVQEVHVQPVPQSRAWNLSLSLTQNARRGDEIDGVVTVAVEGLRGDKVVDLDGAALGDAAQKDGLPFHLKYFQQLHATLVLPADFRPMRLRIEIKPADGEPASRTVAWSDALNGNIITGPGDHHAQP
jgi:hypothetical protein